MTLPEGKWHWGKEESKLGVMGVCLIASYFELLVQNVKYGNG